MKTCKAMAMIAITAVTICFLAVETARAAEPIKIGFVGGFKGLALKMTKDAENAAILAVEEINSQGGVLGHPLQMITKDGGVSPESHAALMHEVIEKEKVVAVFGGAISSCVLAASEVAKEKKIPYLVSVGNGEAIVADKGHPYIFLFEPNTGMETKGLAIFASEQSWKKYAFLGVDYPVIHSMLDSFKRKLKDTGTEFQFQTELWHKLGETDFMPFIVSLLRSKAEVLYLGSFGGDVDNFILQAKSAGVFDSMSVFGLILDDTAVALGKELPLTGVLGLSRAPFYYLSEKFPAAKSFTDKYYEKFKAFPGGFSVCCYDSVSAWAAAAEKAGTVEPDKIAETLKGFRFAGLRGDSLIRAVDGQMNCSAYFGPFKFVKEYPFAIMNPITEVKAEESWMTEEEIKAARNPKKE